MYALIKAKDATLATSNEVKTFTTMFEASRAMEREASELLSEIGVYNDAATIGDIIDNGRCYGYRGNYRGNDFCEVQEPGCNTTKWVVFEVPDVPGPKRAQTAAETVSYECADDQTFENGEVLLHKATVTWNTHKSSECHAPERVELRIGGASYKYKAV